ncbi:MAG: IclR family transcriptional regulator [Verrucomicrobiales bacterium]|nr:IclR family transcriptional regulator [Verrucomicrobiales bacterium]
MKGQVGTLVKAMDILDALGQIGPLGVMDLSRKLKMDKSAVSRLLSTLKSREYVRTLADGRHDLGLRIFELGQILQDRMPVRQTVIPHVEALGRETGETASAAHYHHGQVSYLHDCISDRAIRLGGRVGLRCLPWQDVCGKAILAFCHEDYVIACHQFDQQAGRSDLPEIGAMLAELAAIRKKGFAIEKNTDSCIIAAAVPSLHRPCSIALMVGGPASRIKKTDSQKLAKLVIEHAQQTAQSLGWTA